MLNIIILTILPSPVKYENKKFQSETLTPALGRHIKFKSSLNVNDLKIRGNLRSPFIMGCEHPFSGFRERERLGVPDQCPQEACIAGLAK